jgi:ATP-binding cassette subfamily E protein 1
MNKPARIAIVDKNKCKPNKCKQECKRLCPPQKQGKEVIYMIDIEDLGSSVKQTSAKIAESLCIGCNICVKQCPFDAIKIINIPHENPNEIVYRYGPNSFRLYRLPIIKKNQILGIVGQNEIGKLTIVGILSGTSTSRCPSAYGIISPPMKNLAGLNTYLNGYIQSENVRFRE